jgi:hypothetical protein
VGGERGSEEKGGVYLSIAPSTALSLWGCSAYVCIYVCVCVCVCVNVCVCVVPPGTRNRAGSQTHTV